MSTISRTAFPAVDGLWRIPLPGKDAHALEKGAAADESISAPAESLDLATFIVGPENQLAVAAAEDFFNGQRTYTPLVLHGPPGVGKSHLAHGLAIAWRLRHGATGQVIVVRASHVFDLEPEHPKSESGDSISVLVIEDLLPIANKPQHQAEVCRLLDKAADDLGCAIVTSRIPPADIKGLSPALKSRLSEGLAIGLVPPDVETRRTLLERFAKARGLTMPAAAIGLLSQSLAVTAPELMGAVLTLESAASRGSRRDGRPVRIGVADVRAYLAESARNETPTLRAIASATARRFSLRVADLRGDSRRRAIVMARDIAMHLARRMTASSLEQIGKYFGGRDHTTVLHGCRKIEELIQTDAATRRTVEELRDALAFEGRGR